jgi:DNA-binding LacI/PurR family transcriptional regulator
MGLLLVPGSMGSPEERGAAAGGAAVDGFVVYSMADDDPLVESALRRGLPAVTVDQPLRDGVPFVGIDDEAAAMAEAEHLAGLGHARYGVVSFALAADGHTGIADAARQRSATYLVTRSRLEGYAAALSAAGLSWEEVPVYECPGSTTALGRTAAHALLDLDPRPTAILATSDQLALGAIEAAGELGLSVPDDVSVVGFDDVPPAPTATPALTTVHQDHARKGLLAGGLLVARLRGEEAQGPDLQPARLVIRGSTGRARKGPPKRRPTG